jgi:aminoglycoside 6-adenylyltransferase
MENLLQQIVAWAEAETSIRAVILTGSFGRDAGHDEFSDLDIELYSTHPKQFSDQDEWMRELGEVWMYEPLHNDQGYPTRLVIFDGGKKVDFTLARVEALDEIATAGLSDLHQRGYKVLVDKDARASSLPAPRHVPNPVRKPTEAEFKSTVEEFWFEAYHVAKYLRRDDLWAVKIRDWTTKELLLRIIEWHEKVRHGWDYDTRHLGIGIRHWADPQIIKRLDAVFGRFDASESKQALERSMELFRELARKTAAGLKYEYPEDVDRRLSKYISDVLARC